MPHMAKNQKKKVTKSGKKKNDDSKGLFDHLNALTRNNDPSYWDSLTEAERKTFQPYMINRFLSMNSDWTEFVNDLQRYTVGLLSKRDVFRLYFDVLPKGSVFLKYVKSTRSRPIPEGLAPILVRHFECSNHTAKEYFEMLMEMPGGKDALLTLMQDYGMQLSEQKKIRKELGL